MWTFCPAVQPSSWSPCRNAALRASESISASGMSTPMRRARSPWRARAASGEAPAVRIAAPPHSSHRSNRPHATPLLARRSSVVPGCPPPTTSPTRLPAWTIPAPVRQRTVSAAATEAIAEMSKVLAVTAMSMFVRMRSSCASGTPQSTPKDAPFGASSSAKKLYLLVGTNVNGSSLPHCSGIPAALNLAERAFDRWIASSIISGVAEVGGFFAFGVAVAVVVIVVCADADGPAMATAATAAPTVISSRRVCTCFIFPFSISVLRPVVPDDQRASQALRLVESGLVMVLVLAGRRFILLGAQPIRQQFHIGEQVGSVIVGDAQGGHAHAFVPGGELEGDGVLLVPNLFRISEVAHQPAASPVGGDAIEVRADAITVPNGVAGRAQLNEQGLARGAVELVQDIAGVAFRRHAHLVAPFRIHGTDSHDDSVKVAEQVVPPPTARRVIAKHDLVAVLADVPHFLAQLAVDRPNVLQLSGEERPAGTGVKRVGISFELVRRIVLRIDGDGIEEDVTTHAVAQLFLHLGQPRRRDRAEVRARREDEAEKHQLALDQVIIEPQRLPILGDDRQVGEIAFPPRSALRLRSAREQNDHARKQRDARLNRSTHGVPLKHRGSVRRPGPFNRPPDQTLPLGSPSGRISGVVKNTPSGVGLGVGVTAVCGDPGTPVRSWSRCNMAKSSCMLLWQCWT